MGARVMQACLEAGLLLVPPPRGDWVRLANLHGELPWGATAGR